MSVQNKLLENAQDIEKFIEKVGFALCVGVKDVPLINIWDHTVNPHWEKTIGPWLDELIIGRRIVYPLSLRKKACVMSPKFLPIFYRLISHEIDLAESSPDTLYKQGLISKEASIILAALKEGSLGVTSMRRLVGLTESTDKRAFEKVITELREALAIVKVDTTQERWGENVYARTIDVFPEIVHHAKQLTYQECYEEIVLRYLQIHTAIEQSILLKMFPWHKSILQNILKDLSEQGRIVMMPTLNQKGKPTTIISKEGE